MLAYAFMRRALFTGLMLSIIIPLIGTIVVNRKTSTIGDALSHTSLAGISLGLILSINPLIGAICASIFGAFSIEKIRSKFPQNGDLATAIITSLGIGLASILSDFVPGSQNFESFLFGSIISISQADMVIIGLVTILVVGLYLYLEYGLLSISVNETQARLSGVKVALTENLFTLVLAITIAVASKIVGVLIISSTMILPVASAMMVSKNYRWTVRNSILYGVAYMMVGIIVAYYLSLKPGGTIVIVSILGLIVSMGAKKLRQLVN